MKYFLSVSVILIFISCAGSNTHYFFDNDIKQTSVVETDFQNSFLYLPFIRSRIEGPLISGLRQTLVPQGMAYWVDKNLMIISHYSSDATAGVLTFTRMDTGSLEKVLFLYNHDGTPHLGHLGGLAVSDEYLWLASGSGVYHIKLDILFSVENGESITLSEIIETETKGSFATVKDNVLWVGEFTLKNGSYPVSQTHKRLTPSGSEHLGWLGGYILDDKTDLIKRVKTASGKIYPDYIYSIPDKIQGAVFFENKILLSESYGRRNYSRLLLYHISLFGNPLGEGDVPLQFLDGNNQIGEIIVPPMSEAVVLYNNSIAVLFESAAEKYRETALYPLDRIQYISIPSLNSGNFAE